MTAAGDSGRSDDARLAARLLAIDPVGLGGAVLTGPPGPERDAWLALCLSYRSAGSPVKRLPPFVQDDRLLGGLDLAATLSLKRPVIQPGLLAEADGGVLVIPSAERLDDAMAARIAGVHRKGEIVLERDGASRRLPSRFAIVAFDERRAADEPFPMAVDARCAFRIDLAAIGVLRSPSDGEPFAAPSRHAAAPPDDEIIEALVRLADAMGISALTTIRQALAAALAHAALHGRLRLEPDDAAVAARLVLAPRATRMPAPPEAETAEPPPDQSERDKDPSDEAVDAQALGKLDDILRESVATALPAGLLEAASAGRSRSARAARSQGGGGRKRHSPLRGRPLGARAGAMRPGARLALLDTLRAAAPWQAIRKQGAQSGQVRIEVRPSDFRIRRFAERREATIVFCVDASGSTAFQRLAEAKGAVERLLAEAYVARTHAALVTFRGQAADIALPPTRSLARARSLLANLPGGGGTPVATGLDAALAVALAERARGRDPMIVVLTDGSANVARDGAGGRERAAAEALNAAEMIATAAIPAVFIDTAPRPRSEGRRLAEAMRAALVALPYVDAVRVGDAVRAARA